jgi:hypothetical protein
VSMAASRCAELLYFQCIESGGSIWQICNRMCCIIPDSGLADHYRQKNLSSLCAVLTPRAAISWDQPTARVELGIHVARSHSSDIDESEHPAGEDGRNQTVRTEEMRGHTPQTRDAAGPTPHIPGHFRTMIFDSGQLYMWHDHRSN